MKKLLVVFLLVLGVGFSPNSKVPRYFIAQAIIETNNVRYGVCCVIRATDVKEADIIFRRWAKNRQQLKAYPLPKTNTTTGAGNIYSVWEIDFDKVLHL